MVKFVKIVLPFLPALAHALYEQDQSQHSMFNGWAKEGNADAIKRHLNKFEGDRLEFVSAGDHWEKQATHYAAEHGHADVLKLLNRDFNAPVDAVDYRGRTPLHLAAMNGKLDVIKELLHLDSRLIHVTDKEGRNALHFAAEAGQFLVIKHLIGEDKLDVDSVSGTGKSALMSAAERGHVDFVNLITSKFHANQLLKDASGMTAMMMAAKIGHSPIVSSLYKAENGSAALAVTDNHGRNAFLWAVSSGQSVLVDWMINHTDVDITVKDSSNTNGLHIAAAAGHQNVCSQLINRHPLMMYESDVVDQTALHMATRLPENGFTEILEFHTPLPLGKFTCLDLLLKNHKKIMDSEDTADDIKAANSDFVNKKDKLSQTALSRAVEYGCSTTVNRLFKAGADVNIRVDSKNKRQRNMNMLHWAVSKDQIGVIDTLIRHGVDRSDKAMVPDHATPLTLAVKLNNYLATVKMLHYNNDEHNTLEIADKQPRTPLIWAVANGNSDILKALIGNGANVDFEADGQKLTALHFAAAKGDAEIVKILLDAKADYTAHDSNGISALDTALYYNNPTVLKTIILHYQVQYGEDQDSVLSDMFTKAIDFANSQTVNLNTAEEVQRREEVLKILEDAAAEHLESFMEEMGEFEYNNLDFQDYYADYYGDEFYQLSFYDNYYNPSENENAKRKKRSPRHLK